MLQKDTEMKNQKRHWEIIVFALMMFFSVFIKAPAQVKNFYDFQRKGHVLVFSTVPMIADTVNCIAIRFLNNEAVDTLKVVPDSGKNRDKITKSWKILLKEGYYDLIIELRDVNGLVYRQPYNVKYKRFGYWILSVGTGDHQKNNNDDGLENLKCSSDDARSFVKKIQEVIKPGAEIEECLTGSDATKNNINKAVSRIEKDVCEKSGIFDKEAVFIYFSGHGKRNGLFQIQVKDTLGWDSDWLKQEEIAKMMESVLQYSNNMDIWLFIDACNSDNIYFGQNAEDAMKEKSQVVIYSSMIKDGSELKFKMPENGVEHIKDYDSLMAFVQKVDIDNGEIGDLENKAIDGLFMNFFERVLNKRTKPIKYDELHKSIKNHYNEYLADSRRIVKSGDTDSSPSPKIPINVSESISDFPFDKFTSEYFDFSIGYNLSRQGNIQIGYSLPKFSAFVECSGAWHWTDSITHIIDGVKEKLPSKRIGEFGAGIRHYPFSYGKLDVGYGVSFGVGYIYGEKESSVLFQEPQKDYQLYYSFTPVASLRFFTSKNHRFKLYYNVGYRLYLPCRIKINEDIKWRSAVTSFGVSIPIN